MGSPKIIHAFFHQNILYGLADDGCLYVRVFDNPDAPVNQLSPQHWNLILDNPT